MLCRRYIQFSRTFWFRKIWYMLFPWGDIIIIAQTWCVTKDGGYLIIVLPCDFDNEYIRFNGDRGYGKIRYPYLTTNWKQFYICCGVQRVHVFTKSNYI